MKCKRQYVDKEKYRKYHNGYNRRYYKRTEDARNRNERWTESEVDMILEKKHLDRELSDILGRSVRAIQLKRSKIVAGLNKNLSGV